MYTYQYPRAALTVDAIVVAGETGNQQILLIQRGKEPFKGYWALPGGFIEMDETLEQACIRELFEETGVRLEAMNQFYAFDAIGRDPRHRTISVVYYCFLKEIVEAVGNDDAANAQWFSIRNLPDLAFDHQTIILKFLKQINL
jgi:8-oxo-dGTP diphosphatase